MGVVFLNYLIKSSDILCEENVIFYIYIYYCMNENDLNLGTRKDVLAVREDIASPVS